MQYRPGLCVVGFKREKMRLLAVWKSDFKISARTRTHAHTMQARNRVATAEKHFTEQVFQCSLSLTNGVESPEDHHISCIATVRRDSHS